uniref:N-glycosylase/DNA lyase n=1 Tax=Ciona savignyi TaxID=51511 RepID=H2Y8S5_CIOSA
WKEIPCNREVLSLRLNLTCGQAFRWRIEDDDITVGVMQHRVWQLKQDETHIYYRVIACAHWSIASCTSDFRETMEGWCREPKKFSRKRKLDDINSNQVSFNQRNCQCHQNEKNILFDYLRLGMDLRAMYSDWCNKDKRFAKVSSALPGIRMLRQDPSETLFSFICSVNNNITRIVSMIEKMCNLYGEKLLDYKGTAFYDFPSLPILASQNTDKDLRELGFGYRAPYIGKCAREVLNNGGEKWLNSLRKKSYKDAFSALCNFTGVGMKVSDCVCLMSLDKLEAVPVDTHVRQVALRDYKFEIKTKTLSTKTYQAMGDYFRDLWGLNAGWAQAVIFVNEIKQIPQIYE